MARAVAGAVIAIVAAATRKGLHHTAEVTRVIVDTMARQGVGRPVTTSAYPMVGHRPRLPVALLRRVFAISPADAGPDGRRGAGGPV